MQSADHDQDPHNLARFVKAQAQNFDAALAEIRAGEKTSHWMWYVFPQVHGLGTGDKTIHFAICSRGEAKAYLAHPVLGPRLIEISEAALAVEGRSARQIFGKPDDRKLHSSATLFDAVLPDGSVFDQLLAKFFAGVRDENTLRLLGRGSE